MKGFVLSVVLALCSVASVKVEAAELWPLAMHAHWIHPDADPNWEPWMSGCAISIEFTYATLAEGLTQYTKTQYIDSEWEIHAPLVDVEGMDPGHVVLLQVKIPEQVVFAPGKLLWIGEARMDSVVFVRDLPTTRHFWLGLLDFYEM